MFTAIITTTASVGVRCIHRRTIGSGANRLRQIIILIGVIFGGRRRRLMALVSATSLIAASQVGHQLQMRLQNDHVDKFNAIILL